MKAEYELSAHRYRELKYFCLQYPEMKRTLEELTEIDGYAKAIEDPTSKIAVLVVDYQSAIKLIETTAYDTERFLGDKVLEVVTKDIPWDRLA